ncbi:MAG: YdaS family helix-turn-helix protein [Pseudomonadota bacterium]
MQEIGVEKAIRYFKNISNLARNLKINREKIYRYREGRSPIPEIIAKKIENLTQGEITCKELLPWKSKYHSQLQQPPCFLIELPLKRILITEEIPCFLDQNSISIPNQRAICVDQDNQLIYGLEAIEASKQRGKGTVLAWRLSLIDLVNRKYDVDDLIKAFDLIERAAIGVALEKFLGERRLCLRAATS